MITRLFLTIGLAVCVTAQTLTITGPATARPGTQITALVSLSGTTEIAAINWTLIKPEGVVVSSAVASTAATNAGKQLQSNPANGAYFLGGLNKKTFAPAEIMRYAFTLPKDARGPLTFSVGNGLYASSVNGEAVALTAGPTWTVTVLDPADLNGDTKIDGVDLLISVNQLLGISACSSADLNADGKCDLKDVLLLIVASGVTD